MKNLSNYKINSKKVLFRADLNVPVLDGVIADSSRILAIKSSIENLIASKNKIFILAHFGRPKGKVIEKYSLKFILSSLAEILEVEKIHFLKTIQEENISKKINEMNVGKYVLLKILDLKKVKKK